jgi:hypothetical protein
LIPTRRRSVDLLFLVTPRRSVSLCGARNLDALHRGCGCRRRPVLGSFGRTRGSFDSLRGWRAVALGPVIVLGKNVKDTIAATTVGLTSSARAETSFAGGVGDAVSLRRPVELPLLFHRAPLSLCDRRLAIVALQSSPCNVATSPESEWATPSPVSNATGVPVRILDLQPGIINSHLI